MSTHVCKVEWSRAPAEAFTDGRYSRTHRWSFDGGAIIAASASPDIVPLPYSNAADVDPEECFVAALASCHMLFFLHLAACAGWVVDAYEDCAEGTLTGIRDGDRWVSAVRLRPAVRFAGKAPDRAEIEALHHDAHARCFLARSVKSAICIDLSRQTAAAAGEAAAPLR